MNALDLLGDILDRVNAGQDSGHVCPHVTLQDDVTNVDGYVEAEDMILAIAANLVGDLFTGQLSEEEAARGAGHTIAVAVALGVAMGRADVLDNLDTFQSVEAPADASTLDVFEPVRGEN